MSNYQSPRGLESNQELDRSQLAVDLRPWPQKLKDFLEKPQNTLGIGLFIASLFFIFPFLTEVILLISIFYLRYAKNIQTSFKLPFRTPKSSGVLDLNFTTPGTKPDPKKHQPKAITYFGNERRTKKEMWFENDDLRTHILIFGSTGAGKALRNKELIHTPSGWKKNEDLKVGDLVTTPFGSSPIIGVFPQGQLQLYQITFSDFREIKVSADHLWEVHNDSFEINTKINNLKAKVLTTLELMDLIKNNPLEVYKNLNAKINNAKLESNKIDVLFNYLKDEYFIEISKDLSNDLIIEVLLSNIKYNKYLILKNNKQYSILNIIQEIFYSQGYGEIFYDDNNISINLDKKDFINFKNISKLKSKEDCQCIKIADPRGLFVTKDYIVTHNTEALLSLAFNSLVQGSGLIYVDGKGDVSLFTKIFSMARRIGREDDILVINYMTGSRDVFGPQEQKLSNTLNPFASGSSGGLTELLVSLMDDGGSDGMWKGRAISLISAIMMALCYMRDNDGLLLDVDVIREYLILDNIIKLYKQRKDLPSNIRQSVRGYLVSLPGFQENSPKQNDTALEQHGYLQMQFTKLLGSLSDTYGYIFKTNLGEVDFKDVVLNRRILIVLLPALEKSSDELANLGKIIVACLKQMMAEGLGNKLEGFHDEVIETRPTNSLTPFTTILDEYGYYSVKGAAVMPAQARSLGFSMIFAGQDYAAFKKGDEKEAESIVANCNIKIFMKLEDPMATFELFEKSVGEALTTQISRYNKKKGGFFGGGYAKDDSAGTEMKKRGNLLDLKDQGPGEAHIIFKSALVRGIMFYANPKNAKEYRVNYFVKVEPPDIKEIQQMDASLRELYEKINDKAHVQEVYDFIESEDDFISQIKNAFIDHNHLPPTEAAFATIAKLGLEMNKALNQEQEDLNAAKASSAKKKINIFSDDDIDEKDSPFLNSSNLRQSLSEIDMSSGMSKEQANKLAEQTMDDLKQVSQYPFNGEPEDKDPDEILDILQEVMDDFDIEDDNDDNEEE